MYYEEIFFAQVLFLAVGASVLLAGSHVIGKIAENRGYDYVHFFSAGIFLGVTGSFILSFAGIRFLGLGSSIIGIPFAYLLPYRMPEPEEEDSFDPHIVDKYYCEPPGFLNDKRVRLCWQCGMPVLWDSFFCEYCGALLRGTEPDEDEQAT